MASESKILKIECCEAYETCGELFAICFSYKKKGA
jgi:hypothetical protein